MDKPKNWMFDVDAHELEYYYGPRSSQEEAFEYYACYFLACALGCLAIVLIAAAFIYAGL